MKKILLIGGCGYIGSSIYQYLTKQRLYIVDTVDLEWFGNYINPNNKKIDFEWLTTEQYQYFLNSYDVIVLTAAHSSVPLCNNLYDAFDNNVIKFIRLVSKLKKQKFIYASSSCVYVSSDERPRTEEDSLDPVDGLTLTKTTIDSYMKLSDVEFYGLRFGSVSGWSPNLRLDLMINAMTLSAIDYKHVNVYNKNAHRPILDIIDLCRAVHTIIESERDNRGIYNITTYNDSIYNIGSSIANYFNVPLYDHGNNFTYDFTISSQKFIDTFNFTFIGTIETIVNGIITNPHDSRWERRDEIHRK